MSEPYDRQFFANHHDGSVRSAREIIPIIRELIAFSSVVDVGCGTGTWLSVFAETGTTDYLGIDGAWVDPAALAIPRERFSASNLATTPKVGRRFDLAVSVEVGEHLPASAACRFVDWLTDLAPVVIFSAAIPGQGGTSHINEQWPDYWARLFDARNYTCIDAVRLRIWSSPNVQWWYAQNILIYADRASLAEHPRLAAMARAPETPPSRLVHPECFDNVRNKPIGLATIVRETPRALKRAIKARLRTNEPRA